MKRNLLIRSGVLLCLALGLTLILASTSMSAADPNGIVDTPEVKVELEKARQLAGDDKSFLQLERMQCRDLDDNGMITEPPGNHFEGGEITAVPTKVFDNVYYVGGTEVGGWVIDTGDGYIMLDSMYTYTPETILVPNMKKLGLDPSKVKYILITHGVGHGGDHAGGVKYFNENYGTKVVVTAQDWVRHQERAAKTGETWIDPKDVIVGTDGQTLTLGDTTITMVLCPKRLNGGGYSYLIPVKVNGEPHMWATYGNTGISGKIEDKMIYRKSVAKFLTYMDELKADIAISSHPFVDGSLDRMAQIRNSKVGDPNPFLIGREAAKNYIKILDACVLVSMEREKAGLDDYGRIPDPNNPTKY